MFVDDHTMISLEFIFYQKDGKYSILKKSYNEDVTHNDSPHFKDGPVQLIDPQTEIFEKSDEAVKLKRSTTTA